MTEHELQESLTSRWLRDGIKMDSGEILTLLACEVMAPSWRINDAQHRWGEPAADFFAVDELGRPVVIELKPRLTAPSVIRRAILQVTAMALLLAASASTERLEKATHSCRSGFRGRSGERATPSVPRIELAGEWRRVVAGRYAEEDAILRASQDLGLIDLPHQAARLLPDAPRPDKRMLRRIAEVGTVAPSTIQRHVEALDIGPAESD